MADLELDSTQISGGFFPFGRVGNGKSTRWLTGELARSKAWLRKVSHDFRVSLTDDSEYNERSMRMRCGDCCGISQGGGVDYRWANWLFEETESVKGWETSHPLQFLPQQSQNLSSFNVQTANE
jgi:hypothetical protein